MTGRTWIRLILLGVMVLFAVGGHSALSQETVRHQGDLVIEGDEVFTIEDVIYRQRGDIIVRDNARLIIRNATLIVDQDFYLQYSIVIRDQAELVAENAVITSNFRIEVHFRNEAQGRVSRLTTDWIIPTGHSTVTITNSRIRRELIVGDQPTVSISDSTLNTLHVFLEADVVANFQGLQPGLYRSLDFGTMIASGTEPRITLENTEVQRWSINIPYHVKSITFSDSHPGKLTLKFYQSGSVQLDGLRPGFYEERSIGNVTLLRTTIDYWAISVKAWGLQLTLSTLRGGVGVYFTGGNAQVRIIDSTINLEALSYNGTLSFDQTTVQGRMVFKDSIFTVEGSLRFATEASFLTWHNTIVERTFAVLAADEDDQPLAGARITLMGADGRRVFSGTTDAQGRTEFRLSFTDDNYQDEWTLKATLPDGKVITRSIGFLTDTPIEIRAGT